MSKFLKKESQSTSLVMPGFLDDIYVSHIRESSSNALTRDDTNLEELSLSIRHRGLLQPIIVRPMEDHYQIVAGNRRFRACKILGWKKIACHIVELDDKTAFEISLIENIHRRTFTPIEEANAFKTYVSDFGWGGVSDLAKKIGKSASYVTKRIKLLNLPLDVQESIKNHTLDTSIAEELYCIKDENNQSSLAELISDRRLSMRATRELLKHINEVEKEEECEQEYNYFNLEIFNNYYTDRIRFAERSFDKSITAIRIAMKSLGDIINNIENDWVTFEILMQHKNMLHSQIDILFKEKRKYDKRSNTYQV
jgi:ParB family transcriptional regulator, chromosome partitioning protein